MLTSFKKLMALAITSVLPFSLSSAGQGKPEAGLPNFLSFMDGDMAAKKSTSSCSEVVREIYLPNLDERLQVKRPCPLVLPRQ